jgi:hypothetical protein
MPSTLVSEIFIEKLEDVSTVLLLPLFCFYRVKNSDHLLSDPYLWWICLLIITVAVMGKFVEATRSSFVGQTGRKVFYRRIDEHQGIDGTDSAEYWLRSRCTIARDIRYAGNMAVTTTFMTARTGSYQSFPPEKRFRQK